MIIMKWALYAIGMIFLFVMLFFGMSLISTGQEDVPAEIANDPGYKSTETSADILVNGLQGIPWVLGIIAVIAVFAYLNRRH